MKEKGEGKGKGKKEGGRETLSNRISV